MSYKLSTDGDTIERYYWNLFIKDEFPSYEDFWLKFVVLLTNRPRDIYFKNDLDLSIMGKSILDLPIAQLGYSMIRNLGRCFDIIKILELGDSSEILKQTNYFIEFFVRLVGAQDNTFELLERMNNFGKYTSFDKKSGEKARQNWRSNKNNPLQSIRSYRNSLVHGRLTFSITGEGKLYFPEIGTEDLYLDWRIITDHSNLERIEKAKLDFIPVLSITKFAWEETIKYLENNFKRII